MLGIFSNRSREIESLERQLQETKNQLSESQGEGKSLLERIGQLEKYEEEFNKVKSEYEELKEKEQAELEQAIDTKIKEIGISKNKFEQLMDDRVELIELYVDKLYSLSKHFARENKEAGENRGLFIILVDERNLNDRNFSVFHERQIEHLNQESYIGIDRLPHIFSPKIQEVFSFMGEKVESVDKNGEVIGYDERDGALLINLKGVAFMSRMMVEGVRTHKVYDKVEPLLQGNAKHNAAIYASSLDEVMAVFVISEETSRITLFRDGEFVKSYDPYADVEKTRAEVMGDEKAKETKVVPMKKVAVAGSAQEEIVEERS